MVMKGDVKKNLLAIYEIVIEYGGKDYIFYLSNDGNRYSVEALPVDQQRLAQVNITGIITLAIGVGIIALIAVQTRLNNLIAEKDAARRSFIYDNVALQGVLSDVSGDASAFE